MPTFYNEMPVGLLQSVHAMCVWMKYSETREYEDMLTAKMACDFFNTEPEPELSLKNLLIK